MKHHATTQRTGDGTFIQAVCVTCGWAGKEHDRMSDDYAASNAQDDAYQHMQPGGHTANPEAKL